jgi:hypothetical protein
VRLFVLFLLILPCLAFADDANNNSPDDSVVRNPIDFVRKKLLDVRVGPGYDAYENIRVHGQDVTGSHSGVVPLYDARIGPVNFSNIFDQANFTKGKGPRLGLLFTYTGDAYRSPGFANRDKTLFGGGFLGYGCLTLYGYSDLLGKKAGVIYVAHFAPLLFRIGKTLEFFFVAEAEYMNRLYVDYYFGVRAWEANATLTSYDGRPSLNASATLLLEWKFSRPLEFTMWATEKNYGVGVTDSPTVALKHAYNMGAGLLLRIF